MTEGALPAKQRTLGSLLILLSAAAFGSLAIFARLAMRDGVDTTTLLFLRFAIAAVGMFVVRAVRREAWPDRRTLFELGAMGGIGYVGQSLCYFGALNFASAGLVALLLYLFPAIVAVLAVAFLGERLTPLRVAALILALGGSMLTIELTAGGDSRGILLALAAAVIYSVYIVVGRRVTAKCGSVTATTVIISSAAVVYAVIGAARGLALPRSLAGWLAIVGLGFIATVVAIVAFFAGLQRVGATTASMLSTFEPVTTIVLAALILGEGITTRQLIGGLVILTAVVMLTLGERK